MKRIPCIFLLLFNLTNCADIVEVLFDAALDPDTYTKDKKQQNKPQKTSYERFQEDMQKVYKNDETIIETDYQREQRTKCENNEDCRKLYGL